MRIFRHFADVPPGLKGAVVAIGISTACIGATAR